MGRPLNKKFFGNRNIGSTSTTTDNGIGGQAAGSVSFGGANNSSGFSAGSTQVTLSAPTIPGGVTATASLVVGPVGALLTTAAGTSGTNVTTIGTLTGTAVATTATYTSVPQKSSNGSGTGATFIVVRTGGTNYNANTVVTANGKGTGYTSGNTVTISGANLGGVDGTNDLTITLGGSVAAAGTITAINIVEPGSGYVTVPTFTFSTGTIGTAGPVVAFAADTGPVGSATNEENAILAYAYIGGSLRLVDIIKQISTKRYKVRYNGTNYVARIRHDAIADGSAGYTAAEGVELNMIAQDASNGTYLVRKLYNRTCTLASLAINNSTIGITNNTAGTVFADNKQTKWTFGSADSATVKIQNA